MSRKTWKEAEAVQKKIIDRRLEELKSKKAKPWFDYNHHVIVQHQDGTSLHFSHAFMLRWNSYILVFSEHNGEHIFHTSDLHDWFMCERMKYDEIGDDGKKITKKECDTCGKTVPVAQLTADHTDNYCDRRICGKCYDKLLDDDEDTEGFGFLVERIKKKTPQETIEDLIACGVLTKDGKELTDHYKPKGKKK